MKTHVLNVNERTEKGVSNSVWGECLGKGNI